MLNQSKEAQKTHFQDIFSRSSGFFNQDYYEAFSFAANLVKLKQISLSHITKDTELQKEIE